MYTAEQQAWLNKGNKITVCRPSNRRPEPRKGPVYTFGRDRSGAYLPPIRDLNFDYSK